MPQTSYSITHAAAYEGNIAESGFTDKRSARNNMASTNVPFGRMVVADVGSGESALSTKLPAALTDIFKGVSIYDHAHENIDPTSTANLGIVPGDLFSILQKGVVWMACETACDINSKVYVRTSMDTTHAAVGGTNPALGKVRTDVDNDGTNDRAVLVSNARILDKGAAGDLVRVQFNLP